MAGDWLAVSPLTGNKGDNELIITLASNPSAEDREGEVIIQCGEVADTVIVRQNFNYLATLSKDGDVRTWQEHTKGWGINLVMMGDGFVEMDMGERWKIRGNDAKGDGFLFFCGADAFFTGVF